MFHHYLPKDLVTPYLISEWAIRIVMLFFVPSRRTPQAAQAWLLLIFFLPIPGLILYAAIGRPCFPRWRTERFHRLAPFFAEVARGLGEAGGGAGGGGGGGAGGGRGGGARLAGAPSRIAAGDAGQSQRVSARL